MTEAVLAVNKQMLLQVFERAKALRPAGFVVVSWLARQSFYL